MKVLIVCSVNSGKISSFIQEQAASLNALGVEIDYFPITGKGVLGYLRNLRPLRKHLQTTHYNLIHAHYGLSGLLANLQRRVPVVTTFHGSDIWYKKNRWLSKLAFRLSVKSIFVHPDQPELFNINSSNSVIIPCGIDTSVFYPINKEKARQKLGLRSNAKYALFSSSFNKQIKNARLAFDSLKNIDAGIELLELKGYSREEVNLLMNAVDILLVTSFNETGPLVIKEALACNTPFVSTEVGDVRYVTSDTRGCYISTYDTYRYSRDIQKALDYLAQYGKTDGRQRIFDLGLDLPTIAGKVYQVYKDVLRDTLYR